MVFWHDSHCDWLLIISFHWIRNHIKVLLKYNPTLRELVFAQKSIQNENDLATKVSKPSIQQKSNTHRCWAKITTRVDSLQVGYEHQITILVCDDDGKS